MAKRNKAAVEEYLAKLPEERRAALGRVREVILDRLPEGYEESVNWGMICYEIPLEHYPVTYNGKPLSYAALAARKNCCTLYLMNAYQDSAQERRLREGFARAGLKLDMGKSCIRFRTAEDLPLDVIGEVIASTPPEQFIASYEASRRK
jgi:uncharacterized protein YdhG (YjbR/CyaY superfamily)